MAKPTKVQSNDESDNSESDDEEYSKKDLMDMLEQDHSYMEKRKECKELRKKHDALEQSFDELNTTHERLKEAHEKLGKAHTKLKKAHSTLFSQVKEVVVTCDVGSTYHLLNESSFEPIIVAPTNPSYSSFTTTSSTSDGFTYDASLMVENGTLKKEVNELTRALGNTYGGKARLLKCLDSQRFSLNKEGLTYTLKKARRPLLLPKLAF
jgi:hypothetical protein